MRTLKKTLCLVLALVMVLGVCAFSASATDFKDDAKITYKEAVSVLNGIGVISGRGNGNFDPTATLNRAEAAKIITVLMGGEGLAGKSSFTDMAGFEWAESYVAFAESQGVINGVGGGRFSPATELTGAQWGAMLLRAAGFDDKALGFEAGNKSWEINVAKALKAEEMYKNIKGFDATQPISRDAACELAFQGMQKSPDGSTTYVIVDNDGREYTFDNAMDAAIFRAILGEAYASTKTAPPSGSLMENFEGLNPTTGTDEFGRPTVGWEYGTPAETIYEEPSAVAAKTFTVTVEDKTVTDEENLVKGLNTALNLSGKAALQQPTGEDNKITVKVNGVDQEELGSLSLNVSDEVEVYATKNVVSMVLITRYTAVKVGKTTDLTAQQKEDRNDGATAQIDLGDAGKIYDTNVAGFAYAEGDIVLVALGKNKADDDVVLASMKAETVEGKFSKIDTKTNALTLGGKAYAPSGVENKTGLSATLPNSFSAEYTLYLAKDGTYFAVPVKEGEKTTSPVVYVVAAYSLLTNGADSEYNNAGGTAYYLQCVNLDGEIVKYQITADTFKAVIKDQESEKNGRGAVKEPGLKQMVVDEKDPKCYEPKDLDEKVPGKSVDAKETKATDASVNAEGDNKFYQTASQKIIYLGTDKVLDDLKPDVKTGKGAIPENAVVYGTPVSTTEGEKNHNVVAVFVAGDPENTSTGTGKIFSTQKTSTTKVPYTKADGTTGEAYSYTVWIDGEEKEILTVSASAFSEVGLYTYSVDETTGLYSDLEAADAKAYKACTISNNYNGMIDGDNDVKDLDLTGAKLVNAIADPAAAAKCPTDAAGLVKGWKVTVVLNDKGAATIVYITEAPEA